MKGVLGWDIGGVNTKVARATGTRVAATRVVPYEIQRDPAALRRCSTVSRGSSARNPATPTG